MTDTNITKQIFQKISVNNKEYSSFEDLPEDIKQKLDKDGNGQIDALEKIDPNSFVGKMISQSLEINGKKYADWQNVPQNLQYLKNIAQEFKNSQNSDKLTSMSVGTRSENEEVVNSDFQNIENKPINVSQPLENMWLKFLLVVAILIILFLLFAKDLQGMR